MHGPTLSDFAFSGFSAVVYYGPLEVLAHLLLLHLPEGPRCALLARPWFSLVSIMSASSALIFFLEAPLRLIWEFSGMLAWRFLRALWRTFLVYYRHSLVRLLNSLLLGISSSLVELCGPLDCLVLAFLFGTSWFPHHLFCIAS